MGLGSHIRRPELHGVRRVLEAVMHPKADIELISS